ncbi:MAG: hypothetical protein IH924_09105, partial [Proteobacteria bacterium]|nr:hypothetical protein [Pseudomonadota bacterium]
DAKKLELAKLEAATEHKDKQKEDHSQTAEQQYRAALKEELGSIKILGSPDIESIPVSLLDAFVPLDISKTWRSDRRFDPEKAQGGHLNETERHASPEAVLQRAFKDYRLLLLIGDPGSGKTTFGRAILRATT